MVFLGKTIVSKFDGTTFSVSDMGRTKYYVSTLKHIVFVEKNKFRCTAQQKNIFWLKKNHSSPFRLNRCSLIETAYYTWNKHGNYLFSFAVGDRI